MFIRDVKVLVVSPVSSLVIKDLQIEIDIVKVAGKGLNESKVMIYNLSPLTLARITEGNNMIVMAGYKDSGGGKICCKSTISNIETIHEGSDVVTTFKLKDGATLFKSIILTISYPPNTTAKAILKATAASLGYVIGVDGISTAPKDIIYTQGFSFAGTGQQLLQKMTKALELDYTITDNVLKVYSDKVIETRIVLVLNQTTTILSIKKVSITVGKKGLKATKKTGYAIKTLMEATIVPRNTISVIHDSIDPGLYTVHSVHHTGSVHGSELTTTMEIYNVG